MKTKPSETIWTPARWGSAIGSVVGSRPSRMLHTPLPHTPHTPPTQHTTHTIEDRSHVDHSGKMNDSYSPQERLVRELVAFEHATRAEKIEYIRAFVDDAGHCRPTDRLVLAWRLGLTQYQPGELATRSGTPSSSPRSRASSVCKISASSCRLDRTLWEELLLHFYAKEKASSLPGSIMDRIVFGTGPLCPEIQADGIEVWSEAELATLQALWWWALLTPDPAQQSTLKARAYDHANWLMDEIQPDNATNRPWALGVFAALSCGKGFDAACDALLYAQTLLHNCQVQLGRPDRFSMVLLIDAIALLEMSSTDPG